MIARGEYLEGFGNRIAATVGVAGEQKRLSVVSSFGDPEYPQGAEAKPITRREYVYTVHTVHSREIRGTDTVWSRQDDAEDRASKVSTDPEVLAAAVTRFTLNMLGERHPAALYVGGVRQLIPHISDDRRVFANGLKQR